MHTLYAKALCEWSEGQIDTRLDKIWAGHVFYSYFNQMSAMTLTFDLETLSRSLQIPFIQRYSDSEVWTRIDMGRKYSQDSLYWTEWDRWMDGWMISIVCQQSGNIIINTRYMYLLPTASQCPVCCKTVNCLGLYIRNVHAHVSIYHHLLCSQVKRCSISRMFFIQ